MTSQNNQIKLTRIDKTDSFYKSSTISAQCFYGTEEDPDAGIILCPASDEYCQGHGQNVSCFRHRQKQDILPP